MTTVVDDAVCVMMTLSVDDAVCVMMTCRCFCPCYDDLL